MAGPLHGSDLDDVLDTLAEIGDEDLDEIAARLRNIARRAATGQLDPNHTAVLAVAICASPERADVVGACALTLAEITDHNPALHQLTDDAAKDVTRHGQEAAFRLRDHWLREPASNASAALDHIDPERRCPAVTDEQRKELSKKVADANKKSINRPR